MLPETHERSGAMEVALRLPDLETLHRTLDNWQTKGMPIVQGITKMDFGVTFMGLDPDGHRLRAYVFESTEK